ncbi:urea ABC transporter permease subunit UrtB [Sphingobacterium paludis]|uniref:Urea transport system permease protein n=1 Tax=Sphingobacterium paludis TaxID=1476465 RepID=A0A4R7DAB5_9SPHI|nr:urea ABC transporter permease subunit UrtB [Sphingobacterium paludis]TDS17181.1 urea transport system permease protein [Sphingobacterium paludis]
MTIQVRLLKTVVWGLLCCLSTLSAHALADSTAFYINQVVHPAIQEDRTGALHKLLQMDHPEVYPFLSAIHSSALYEWQGQAVSAIKHPQHDDGSMIIKALYPVYKTISDDNGVPLSVSKSALHAVPVSRPDRLILAGHAAHLDLFNPSAQRRSSAYGEALRSGGINTELLLWALANEEDYAVQQAGKEAYYYDRLVKAGDPLQVKSWTDSIYENASSNAVYLLRNHVQEHELSADLSSYILGKAEDLERDSLWMQRIQHVFSGLSLASILVLISLGLGIVYGLAGIINMAHGEFLMIGAYATFTVQLLFTNVLGVQSSDWFYFAALPISFVVAGVAGLLLERLVVRRLYAKPLDSLLATWGVSLILIQTARWIFGDMTAVKLPGALSGGIEVNPHLVLPYNRIFIIVLTLIIVVAVYWVLMRTRLGLQIRAVTQNRSMSACLGIDTKRVNAITFFVGSGLAGLAGCAMTLIGNVVPDMGQSYIVDSFLMVVIGGVGKIVGIIVSAIGIGISSKVLEAFFEAVYGKVLILVLIMIFMQFRPKGLFPDRGRSAED